MNFKNKLLILFLTLLLSLPLNAFAYSEYVIPGGENVGIQIKSDGILIVGFYEVDNKYIGKDAGFQIGDKIISINQKQVNSINEMIKVIEEDNQNTTVSIEFLRNQKKQVLDLSLTKDENSVYKTGLYVKDQITGIGTLTYIDPESKIYGALGHEIIEKTTGSKFEIKDGKIFKADIIGIEKSQNGSPGEKNARFYQDILYGSINKNEISGIFGDYTDILPTKELIKVGKPGEIKLGEATIQTVLSENTVETFKINILKVDKKNEAKNILFEIKDEKLLEKTGGVVQGMSGSPILQDNKLIGAVTHVIVNDSTKGYGIFITTMLEEGEK